MTDYKRNIGRMNKYIKTAKDAREHIGKKVYWDVVDRWHIYLKSGVVTGAAGKNIQIDGDWKYISDLYGLRNFEEGGRWKLA